MKLALDQTFDSTNMELYSVLHGIDIPEYVKTAAIFDRSEVKGMDSAGFADQMRKLYPITDPGNTYTSYAFWNHKKAELSKRYGEGYVAEVEGRLKAAAELFGITEDLPVLEKAAMEVKPYTPAISCIDHNGVKVAFFECETKEDVEKAADVFVRDIENIPFEWRSQISKDFVKRSTYYGVTKLPELIFKYAGSYYPDFEILSGELYRRAKKYDQSARDKIARVLEIVPEIKSRAEVMKVAELVYKIEKRAGLYENPATKEVLPDIVDTLFALHPQKVAEMLDVIEMGGRRYKVAELKTVPASVYKEAFGIDIDPKDEDRLREVLPTMPKSDVALFEELK